MRIDEMTPADLESQLLRLANNTNKLKIMMIEAKETYQILKTNKDMVFASMCNKVEGRSQAERERIVYCSDGWKEWIKAYLVSENNYERAKVEADNSERLWESCRSILSSKNSERRFCV